MFITVIIIALLAYIVFKRILPQNSSGRVNDIGDNYRRAPIHNYGDGDYMSQSPPAYDDLYGASSTNRQASNIKRDGFWSAFYKGWRLPLSGLGGLTGYAFWIVGGIFRLTIAIFGLFFGKRQSQTDQTSVPGHNTRPRPSAPPAEFDDGNRMVSSDRRSTRTTSGFGGTKRR